MEEFRRKAIWELVSKAKEADKPEDAIGYNTEVIYRLLVAVIEELEALKKAVAGTQ